MVKLQQSALYTCGNTLFSAYNIKRLPGRGSLFFIRGQKKTGLLLAVHQLADGVAESLHTLEHILVADVGEVQTHGVLACAVAEEDLTDDESHVLLDGDFEELLRIQALGHGNEQEETSLRSCPGNRPSGMETSRKRPPSGLVQVTPSGMYSVRYWCIRSLL